MVLHIAIRALHGKDLYELNCTGKDPFNTLIEQSLMKHPYKTFSDIQSMKVAKCAVRVASQFYCILMA